MDGIRLLFRRGEVSLLMLRIDRAEVLVGRGASNDVVVPDPGVPELAARILDRGGERYLLTDLSGGVLRVGDGPLDGKATMLRPGDTFELGGYVLELQARRETPHPRPTRRTGVLRTEDTSPSVTPPVLLYRSQRFDLPSARSFDIGSDADNDLVIEDPFVSSFHCRLLPVEGGRYRIADLDSTNGTTVDGLRIREAELPAEAKIGVGQEILRFTSEARPPVPELHGMLAASEAMQSVFRQVERFAASPEPVLVVGGSGTGKEGVSRALHDCSTRAQGPYLAINCGAFAAGLVESELFGHVKGAFTGATSDKKGAFEAASGGTLFLDEVGELPLELQPKLLRVLETKAVRPVGGVREVEVDTRIVAATHRNLERLVVEGRFREDLFHRLFVLSIAIPPLKERPEDVDALAEHFLRTETTTQKRLSAEAAAALRAHPWPGNVRELRNVLVRAVLTTDGPLISVDNLQFSTEAFDRSPPPPPPTPPTAAPAGPPTPWAGHDERTHLAAALAEAGGNRALAARRLGMSKSTFYDKVRRLGLTPTKDT